MLAAKAKNMETTERRRTEALQARPGGPGESGGRRGPGGPGGRAAVVGLITVCLGFFVIQLDVTIVNVTLPAIQREIGGSVADLQWVVDAYTLALAAVMLTAGSEADRAGARRLSRPGWPSSASAPPRAPWLRR